MSWLKLLISISIRHFLSIAIVRCHRIHRILCLVCVSCLGLFVALKLEIFFEKRYFWVSIGHYSELTYLHVKVEPKTPSLCPGVDQIFFFLKFGFNSPNFTTLGGCPLKNWTFVQKLVSYSVLSSKYS